MMGADAILTRLDGVRRTGAGRWIAKCPAHDDRSPSLSVRDCGDGRTIIHCFAECEPADILAALGLNWTDLYPPTTHDPSFRRKFRRESVVSADDALRCLSHEALIVSLVAGDIADDKQISKEDRERVVLAASRIEAARSVVDD